MPTIGVITTCFSYDEYVPEWAASVAALERQPDQVVLVSRTPHQLDLPGYRNVVLDTPWLFADWLNAGFDACPTDWVTWIGVDDAYLSHALTGWERRKAGCVPFGLEFFDGSYQLVWEGVSADDVLHMRHGNQMPCGSPIRREYWAALPFQAQFTPYEDWAMAVGLASQGTWFEPTGRIDFRYRVHPAQNHPPLEPYAQAIAQWRDSL